MVFKVQDHFFKKAKDEKFLARSVYKLEEIQQKFKILGPGYRVLDLGYYPGSWIQFTSGVVGPKGEIVGVDIQGPHPHLKDLTNVRLYCQDVFELKDTMEIGTAEQFDTVLSDMAPSTTGIRSVDQDRSLNLVEQVFELLPRFLRPGGDFVIKVFESGKAQEYLKSKRKTFHQFHFLRPKSTRSVSKEFFVIGKGFGS